MSLEKLIRNKETFTTTKGEITPQQVWDLPIGDEKKEWNGATTLDSLAVSLEIQHETGNGRTFLKSRTKKDKTAKMKLNFVLSVLDTKLEERAAKVTAKEDKEHNQRILGLIQKKRDEKEGELSEKELRKMLR